jgi:CheY-like chemotaxis protein
MVVDDETSNLRLLEEILGERGYRVRCYERGQPALEAAAANPPDLILLDIDMPEMNGYRVCEELRSLSAAAHVPVLFLSALHRNTDIVESFRCGGADYIQKPFQFEELCARMETHLQLGRARQAECDLLDKTLNGSIKVLTGLVHATAPVVAARSQAIRDYVHWVTGQLQVPDPWKYDVAASLCLLGCVALPEDLFRRAYRGEPLSHEEALIFQTHPATASRLLSDIPRLEPVVQMILLQQQPGAGTEPPGEVEWGGRLLHLAVEIDRRVFRGAAFYAVLDQLKKTAKPGEGDILKALARYPAPARNFVVRELTIKALLPGVVLEQDVESVRGKMKILPKDTELTETWIERLKNFSRTHGIKEPLRVRVPSHLTPAAGQAVPRSA